MWHGCSRPAPGGRAERRERLAEVIIRHMWPRVDVSVDPEGYLLARAAGLKSSVRM